MTQTPSPSRRWIVWTVRVMVVLLVAWGVSGTLRTATSDLSKHDWTVRFPWMLAAGAFYVLGLVPMAWFWWRTLGALGQPAPWPATLRGYFVGHLGKYVPGKAMALILRVAAVKRWVPSMRVALVSTTLETLMMMAVGALLAAAISLLLLDVDRILGLLAAAMAVVVGLPTLPPIARWLARLGVARTSAPSHDDTEGLAAKTVRGADLSGLNWWLWLQGALASAMCWICLGLSLWALLRALGAAGLGPLEELPRVIATVAFAVVVGFLSMLPGGLGVRDAVLVELLAAITSASSALVAAVLLRLVWLVSEMVVCGILYVSAKTRRLRDAPRID